MFFVLTALSFSFCFAMELEEPKRVRLSESYFSSLTSSADTEMFDSEGVSPACETVDNPPICLAVLRDEIMKVFELINKGENINQVNNWGETPLHIAAQNNYEHMAALLLKAKAQTDIRDKAGKTAWDIAQGCKFNQLAKSIELENCKRKAAAQS